MMEPTVQKGTVRKGDGKARTPPAGPILSNPGRTYLGRLIIEAWEPIDRYDDGLNFIAEVDAAAGVSSSHEFVQMVLRRLRRGQAAP